MHYTSGTDAAMYMVTPDGNYVDFVGIASIASQICLRTKKCNSNPESVRRKPRAYRSSTNFMEKHGLYAVWIHTIT